MLAVTAGRAPGLPLPNCLEGLPYYVLYKVILDPESILSIDNKEGGRPYLLRKGTVIVYVSRYLE